MAVSINNDDDDEDDFAERPRVQPAGIGIAPPPKSNDKKSKPKRKNINNGNNGNNGYDLLSQGSDSVFSNESLSPNIDNNGTKSPPKKPNDNNNNDNINDWLNQLPSSSNEALLLNGNQNNHQNLFQD